MSADYRRNELNAAFWSGGWLLALALVFSFFVTMLMLTSPIFMLLIYDRVLSSRSQESLVALFGLVVMLLILMGLFDYARGRVLARFGARLQDRLEARVLKAVEAQSSGARGSGASPANATRELDNLRSFFHSSALTAVLDFIWAPIFLGAVFLFHPLLGWNALTGALILSVIAGLRYFFSRHLAEDANAASSAVGAVAGRIRDAQQAIQSQGMGGRATERWLEARRASRDMSIVLNDRLGWFTTASKFTRMLFQALTLALGANLVLGHQLTVGGMVACFILLARVFFPVEQFLKYFASLRGARASWLALDDILKAMPEAGEEDDAHDAKAGFEIRGLRIGKSGGRGRVINGLDLSIDPGVVARIAGSAGSGKTLLARAIVGQEPVIDGTVTLGGRNVCQFGAEMLGRRIGYLPEETGFFPGTIYENISRMDPGASTETVVIAAKLAGGHAMISGLPKGYDTRVDAHGSRLSRRQRHTIALARALYGRPQLLLLDEPDPTMIDRLCANPRRIRIGAPAILILGCPAARLPEDAQEYRLEGGRLVGADPLRGAPAAANTPKLVKR